MAQYLDNLVRSPLNYTGGKFRLLPQLLPLFPKNIKTFVDLFCGGCNVGINIKADKIICIDNQRPLIRLFNTMKNTEKAWILKTIHEIIDKYGLSESSIKGYEYYNSKSSQGLGIYNKDKYLQMRDDYNNRKNDSFYYDILFYTIVVFSFNNQIRFNKKGEYNVPVGKRDFNNSLRKKLMNFILRIKSINIDFILDDYSNFDFKKYPNKPLFIYADPPYLITTAPYNEQQGWNEVKEKALLKMLDQLDKNNVKFALSNVLESNGKKNKLLVYWSRKYNIHHIDFNYKNSNYQKKYGNKRARTVEALITNY